MSKEITDTDFVLHKPATVQKMEKDSRDEGDIESAASNVTEQHRPQPSSCQMVAEVSQESTVKVYDGDKPCKAPLRGGFPSQADSSLQALLHSQKEQRRRLQIKKCCSCLRDLLPFVNGRLDTASTLELTVSYITYLQQQIPAEILEKVAAQALQNTGRRNWYKPIKASRKRKMNTLKEKPMVKPTTTKEDFANEFIDARVLGRHIQPKTGSTLPPAVPAHPFLLGQPFAATLDLNTSSSRTVILQQTPPSFGQSVAMSQTSGLPVSSVMSKSFAPVFLHQTSVSLSGEANHTITPQISLNSSIYPAGIINHGGPISRPPVTMNQTEFQQLAFDQVYLPSSPMFTNQGIAPLVVLNQNFPEAVALKELCNSSVVVTQPQNSEGVIDNTSFTPTNTVLPQLFYESSDSSLPSSNSFFETGPVDPFLQTHDPGLMFSTWPFPNQQAFALPRTSWETSNKTTITSFQDFEINEDFCQ
ncbi:spermatogenesis- and oogenesis-specific basic helix-loop-helix-containing protein 2 isoform X1 [Arapaima gigas]